MASNQDVFAKQLRFPQPNMAALAMAMSSVTVVSNSLWLRGFHPPPLAASEVG